MPTRFNPTDIASTYSAIAALNANFDDVATLLDRCVFRDGTAPNTMLADLDFNHFKILNLGAAITDAGAVNKAQMDAAIADQLASLAVLEAETVSTRALMAAITSPANNDAAVLTEAGREGLFKFNTSNLSARVTADAGQGVYVAPASDTTGASGAWVRQTEFLTFPMFGALGGATDDTTAIRRCCYLATIIKKPIFEFGGTYRISDGIVVGSLTDTAPAANAADKFTFVGFNPCTFVVASTVSVNEEAYFYVYTAKRVRIRGIRFDIETEATAGYGQVRLFGCDDVEVEDVQKIRTSANFAVGGSGAVSATNCTDLRINKAISRNAGPTSSGVFLVNCTGRVTDAECVGGQEGVDTSSCRDLVIDNPKGTDCAACVELANAQRVTLNNPVGDGCTAGVIIKTEAASGGAPDLGSHDITINNPVMKEWTDGGIVMQAGATATQTFKRITINNPTLTTTVATAASHAIRPQRGDVVADPNDRFVVNGGTAEMNLGYAIQLNEMVNYEFNEFDMTGCPNAVENNTPSSFVTEANGVFSNCKWTGDFTSTHRATTLINPRVDAGKIHFLNASKSQVKGLLNKNSPATALHVQFNDAAAALLGFTVDGYENLNNSVSTAGNWGLLVDFSGATTPIENLTLRNILIRDDQGVATSGGVRLDNFTSDKNVAENIVTRNVVADNFYGFKGATSVNRNVRLHGRTIITNSGSTSLSAFFYHIERVQQVSSAGTITVINDSTEVFPIGHEIVWENVSAIPTFAAAAGVTLTSRGGLLSIPAGGVARLRKTAANTWNLSGDLA